MAPLVSIVLPVYAPDPLFFRQAVQSILEQTFADLELIIVEDPSPSSGREILLGIADPRLRHVVNAARTTLPAQHNLGLSMATGRFICRFDADDVSEPHRIQREIEFLQSHSDVGVVSSNLTVIDEAGKAIATRRYPEHHVDIRKAFRRFNPIANSAVMFRREVYERFGGWRTDSPWPAQDYEWYSRLAAGGIRFANLSEPLVRYRLHGRAMKATKMGDTIRSTIETKLRYWDAEMTPLDRLIILAERCLTALPPRLVMSLFKRVRYRGV